MVMAKPADKKEWCCGNCGFSHISFTTHCRWCGIPPKYLHGLPKEEAMKIKKRRTVPISGAKHDADKAEKEKAKGAAQAIAAAVPKASQLASPPSKSGAPSKPTYIAAAK